jgi:protein gp37
MDTVRRSPHWNFLMPTKFPLRMVDREVPDNVWLGTSVDAQHRVKAVEDAFERVPAHTRWLSLEPLLEPLKFSRPELFQWVVIGCASASSQTARWRPPFEWQIDLYRQFSEAGARVYFKGNALHQEFPWREAQPTQAPK